MLRSRVLPDFGPTRRKTDTRIDEYDLASHLSQKREEPPRQHVGRSYVDCVLFQIPDAGVLEQTLMKDACAMDQGVEISGAGLEEFHKWSEAPLIRQVKLEALRGSERSGRCHRVQRPASLPPAIRVAPRRGNARATARPTPLVAPVRTAIRSACTGIDVLVGTTQGFGSDLTCIRMGPASESRAIPGPSTGRFGAARFAKHALPCLTNRR